MRQGSRLLSAEQNRHWRDSGALASQSAGGVQERAAKRYAPGAVPEGGKVGPDGWVAQIEAEVDTAGH